MPDIEKLLDDSREALFGATTILIMYNAECLSPELAANEAWQSFKSDLLSHKIISDNIIEIMSVIANLSGINSILVINKIRHG